MKEALRLVDDNNPRGIGLDEDIEDCEYLPDSCTTVCERRHEVFSLCIRINRPNINAHPIVADLSDRDMLHLREDGADILVESAVAAHIRLQHIKDLR